MFALQELDIDLRAIDADQFAAAIGKAGRRQQQEEFLEVEALNLTLDGEDGVVIRYRIEQAVAPPCAVDAHDADAVSTAERYPFRCLAVLRHGYIPAIAAALGALTPEAVLVDAGLKPPGR